MAFSTFTVTIDGTQIGGLPESRARLTVVANSGTLKDAAGDKFRFPLPRGRSISLPYSLTLDTDVTTGTSSTIGYEVTVVTDAGGRITGSFAAQAAGTTTSLTDLPTDIIDVPLSEAVRLRNETVAAAASVTSLKQWARTPDALITGAVTRDTNGAATSAPVTWPDGSPGTYTADTLSTAFPGAVDAYHITYGSPVTKTLTQPLITRDATTGAATNVPAITVA